MATVAARASTEHLKVYADWLACLGDVRRLEILTTLAVHDAGFSVGALVEETGLAQATVSYHLKILGDAGFVRLTPSGTSTIATINTVCVQGLPAVVAAILGDPQSAEAALATCMNCAEITPES